MSTALCPGPTLDYADHLPAFLYGTVITALIPVVLRWNEKRLQRKKNQHVHMKVKEESTITTNEETLSQDAKISQKDDFTVDANLNSNMALVNRKTTNKKQEKEDELKAIKKAKEIEKEEIQVVDYRYKLGVVDHLVGLMLIVIMLVNIYCRIARGVGHWLIQPCHWLTALLIYTTYSTSSRDTHFWVFVYSYWQCFFAFFAGDLSWYETQLEVIMFYLQHILLVSAPILFLARGRFDPHRNNFTNFLSIYSLNICYHSLVLIPFGFFTSTDFDNMICPIPGSDVYVGKWWREAMAIFTLPFAFMVCYFPPMVFGWFKRKKMD
jgi:hypothetical protein